MYDVTGGKETKSERMYRSSGDMCVLAMTSVMIMAMVEVVRAEVVTKTYTMPLPPMMGGGVLNTVASKTIMEMPAGRIALKAFNAEVRRGRRCVLIYMNTHTYIYILLGSSPCMRDTRNVLNPKSSL